MSIINSYRRNAKPLINVSDIYTKSETKFDSVIVTFSRNLIDALLEDNLIDIISLDTIKSISNTYPVYKFKGTNIGIFKTTVGASITSAIILEVCYVYNVNKVVLFGSCGSLDKNIPITKLIVPTKAYRDEGVSYHYMEPSDYIDLPNWQKITKIFDELAVDYVTGKTWTTDAFYRETYEEIDERKKEGCIAVEMEISACQAVCNSQNIEFYSFLYRADNLDSSSWERGLKDSDLAKDDRLKILNIAVELAKKI